MDDIEKRFQEITAQIQEEERRRMSRAAQGEWERLPRDRRRRRRWAAAVVALAAAAGAGVLVVHRPELLEAARTALGERLALAGAAVDPAPGRTEPAEPAQAEPSEEASAEAVPLKPSPFDGSPAADYADGAEGLVMPRARAVGGLGEKDVAAALGRARALLKASNLDRRTLFKGAPGPFAKLLHPEERRWFLKNMDRRRKPKGEDFNTRTWLTSFAPKSAEPATDVIKVRGRTKLSPFEEGGISGARVTVNYLFVYAVHRPGRPHTTMRVIAHNVGELRAYREGGRLIVWVRTWNGEGVTGARCDVDDGFVHPAYEDAPADEEAARATGAPIDPYDLDRKTSKDQDCFLASRS
ncbi:hypothetical protein GCM10010466_41830 [Planomonospora alba]|uniref:Tat pathway signal sequence domain protein n=1 Tax=Planomonospora alba TaxID=161354 RepID=A0ABP6NFH1_9ACTN